MKNILLIMMLISSVLYTHNVYSDDLFSQYEDELKTIKRNYHRYSKQLKEIANRRVLEIKQKQLPTFKIVDLRQHAIKDVVRDNPDIPDDAIDVILFRQKNFLLLSNDLQRELLAFRLNTIGYDELSKPAKEYLLRLNLLINDNKPHSDPQL